jgi:hypothetical protein
LQQFKHRVSSQDIETGRSKSRGIRQALAQKQQQAPTLLQLKYVAPPTEMRTFVFGRRCFNSAMAARITAGVELQRRRRNEVRSVSKGWDSTLLKLMLAPGSGPAAGVLAPIINAGLTVSRSRVTLIITGPI